MRLIIMDRDRSHRRKDRDDTRERYPMMVF